MRPHLPDPDRLTPRERYRLEKARVDAKRSEGWDRLAAAVQADFKMWNLRQRRSLELIPRSTQEGFYE